MVYKKAFAVLFVWWIFNGIVGPVIRGTVVDERNEVNLCWSSP